MNKMTSEKMMILKMLEDGKINTQEAARLLGAADGASASPASSSNQAPPRHASPGSGVGSDDGPRPNSPHGMHSAPGKTVGTHVDDMGRKIGAFAKEMEPKVKKFAEVVVEKTASAADSLSKSLSSHAEKRPAPSPTSGQSSAYFPSAPASTRPAKSMGGASGIEEMIEIKVTQRHAELNITGHNGQVMIKGYNGDKISAKIFSVAKRPGARVELATLGNKYYLAFDENDFERVCIDAFVPETMFDNIRVVTTNGDIRIASVAADFLQTENMNGGTEIASVTAGHIVSESNNGHFRISDAKADKASIENFNGEISVSKIDVASLKVTTFNGTIDMQIAAFSAYDYYNWHVETSNGKLGLVLPSYSALGYHIKGQAALDNVKVGLVGMNYLRNDKSYVEAKSINYDSAIKKADMTLTTSNAPLVIN